jgi:Condensin complex subunit 2
LLWQDVERDTPTSVTDPEEARTFDEVIVGLQRSYPGDKLAEISTSFCFICLLHLANERGLRLESGDAAAAGPSSTPEVKEDEKVGNIWSLKVSRMLLIFDFDTSLALGVDTAIGFPGHERYTRSVAEPRSETDYCNSVSFNFKHRLLVQVVLVRYNRLHCCCVFFYILLV